MQAEREERARRAENGIREALVALACKTEETGVFTSSLLVSEEGEVDDKREESLRRRGWNPGHRSWLSLRHQKGRVEECLQIVVWW